MIQFKVVFLFTIVLKCSGYPGIFSSILSNPNNKTHSGVRDSSGVALTIPPREIYERIIESNRTYERNQQKSSNPDENLGDTIEVTTINSFVSKESNQNNFQPPHTLSSTIGSEDNLMNYNQRHSNNYTVVKKNSNDVQYRNNPVKEDKDSLYHRYNDSYRQPINEYPQNMRSDERNETEHHSYNNNKNTNYSVDLVRNEENTSNSQFLKNPKTELVTLEPGYKMSEENMTTKTVVRDKLLNTTSTPPLPLELDIFKGDGCPTGCTKINNKCVKTDSRN